jgi:thiamine pyrophosphate-dependent acetolactate synthase large subunit-like protein
LSPQSEPTHLDPEQIAAAAFLLRLSARPLILAGRGVLEAGAGDVLIRLTEAVGAPVMTTAGGTDAFPQGHNLASGVVFGRPEADALLAESDMVLAVGTSFSSLTDERKPDLPAQMIHVDIDPAQIDRVYPVRNGIVGDAKAALEKILVEIENTAPLKALADARAAEAPARAARAREAASRRG